MLRYKIKQKACLHYSITQSGSFFKIWIEIGAMQKIQITVAPNLIELSSKRQQSYNAVISFDQAETPLKVTRFHV